MPHVVMNDHAFCSIETLNPEISHRNEACTMVEWDFSTPLRYGRFDSTKKAAPHGAAFFIVKTPDWSHAAPR
jgi:hypothetical protein